MELIEAWIKYHAQETRVPDLFWAWEELENLVDDSPDDAWRIILEIAQRTDNQLVQANLAAGPLENLLVKHGIDFIERVETATHQVPAFTRVILGVWKNSMDEDIWNRVNTLQSRYSP